MTAAINLDGIAQAHVARMAALLTAGSMVALAGAIGLRLTSRLSAGARYGLAVVLFALVAIAGIHPEGMLAAAHIDSVATHSLYISPLWTRGIFALWTVIAAAGLLRVLVGIQRVRRLKLFSAAIPHHAVPPMVMQAVGAVHRFGKNVRLLASDTIKVPAAIGFVRPAVVLPAWMVGDPEISADDLHALVLHELAHLRRYDDWVNLGQKILKALLFFHPAAWWLDRRIAAEREMACDDAVLRSSADPHVYARCLVRLAERSYLRRTLELAQAAVGHLRLTTTRVKRLIGGRAQHAKAWRTATVLAAFGSLTSIAALCPTPQLVTFTGPQARVEASAKPTPNQSSVILAASKVERSPGFIPAKLPLSPKLPLNVAAKVRNSQSRPTATSRALRAAATTHDSVATSYWVVIETSQQFVGPEMMQVETWQVVMLSSPPTPRHPIPHKEI